MDQFNRSSQRWVCRSCSRVGKKLKLNNPSPRHDPSKIGAWKSYWRAKKRVKENHKNAYKNIEFRFHSFEQWFEVLGPRPDGMSVDRINVLGHYEPGNVRWATHKEQCRNRTNNHKLIFNGEEMCLTDAAKAAGMHRSTLARRIKAGCPDHLLFKKGKWRYKNGRIAEIALSGDHG